MKKIRNIIFTLFICLVTCSGTQVKAEDNNQKKDQGFFPIAPWCSYYKAALPGIKECNFTVAGFFVEPKDLDYCQKLGLKAILYPGLPRFYGKLAEMSDADIEKTIKEFVLKTKDHPAVLGYYVMDEPGEKAFHAMAIAVKAIKKYAPGKIAHINHYPSWANDYFKRVGKPKKVWAYQQGTYKDFLERYVKEVKPNMLGWDNYRIIEAHNQAQIAEYYENLLTVRKVALAHNIPFWNFIGACALNASRPTYSDLSLQAFTSLAAGVRGIYWFRYFDGAYSYAPVYRPGGKHKTHVWLYLQAVNHQVLTLAPIMLKLNSTGVYFTKPLPAKICKTLPGNVIKKLSADEPLMIGEFKHEDGDDYVMIVNISTKTANLKIDEMAKEYNNSPQIISSVDRSERPFYGRTVRGKNLYKEKRQLPPGQGILIKFGKSKK